jgi:hypothetical protein
VSERERERERESNILPKIKETREIGREIRQK